MRRLYEVLGEAPDGRPGYAWRLTDAKFDLLTAHANEVVALEPRPSDREGCALLCLFISEWLRRHDEGGTLSWTGVVEALELDRPPSLKVVEVGLHTLGRQMLYDEGGRAGLRTLLLEGGLSAQRLQTGKVQELVTRVLRRFVDCGYNGTEDAQTLAKVGEDEARAIEAVHLVDAAPLVGELLGRLWRVRGIARAGGDVLTRVKAEHPDWLGSLPLAIDEQAATELLINLFDRVAKVAVDTPEGGPVSVRTWLEPDGVAYRLARGLYAHRRLGKHHAHKLLGGVDAQRALVWIAHGSGAPAHAGTLVAFGEEFRFDPGSSAVVYGAGEVDVTWSEGPGEARPAGDLSGADALGELPWVFAKRDETLVLVAIGSARRTEAELLVAVAAGSEPEGQGAERLDATVEGRALWRVTGTATWRHDDAIVRIRSGQATSEGELLNVSGRRLDVGGARVVWRGMPKVLSAGGRVVPIQVHGLRGWQVAPKDAVGTLRCRAMRDDEVIWSGRLLVVPEALNVQLQADAKQGTVDISAPGLTDAGFGELPWLAIARVVSPNHTRLVVSRVEGAVPARRAPFTVKFTNGASVTFALPVPLRTMAFEGLDGAAMPRGGAVSLRRLGEVTAVAIGNAHSRFALEIQLLEAAADRAVARVVTLPSDAGRSALALARVRPRIEAMLDLGGQLDAEVRLALFEVGGPANARVTLTVRRYDWEVRYAPGVADAVDAEASDVVAEPTDAHIAAPYPIGSAVRLFRVRLGSDADQGTPIPVRSVDEHGRATYALDVAQVPPGVWLLYALDPGFAPIRATVLYRPGVVPDDEGSAIAACVSLRVGRDEALVSALNDLATRPLDPEWRRVLAMVRLSERLSASTFDALRAFEQAPRAATTLAVCAAIDSDDTWRLAHAALASLAFLWRAVPLVAWRDAFTTMHEALHGAFSAIPTGAALADRQLDIIADRIAQRVPGAAFGYVAHCLARDRMVAVDDLPGALREPWILGFPGAIDERWRSLKCRQGVTLHAIEREPHLPRLPPDLVLPSVMGVLVNDCLVGPFALADLAIDGVWPTVAQRAWFRELTVLTPRWFEEATFVRLAERFVQRGGAL